MIMSRESLRKAVAEFVGTFVVVFIAAGAVIAGLRTLSGGQQVGREGAAIAITLLTISIALAYGLVVAAMVVALGHISGGHFNPAVTIGAALTRRIGLVDAAVYVVAQAAAAAAAGGMLRLALPESVWGPADLGTPRVASGITDWRAVLIEGLITMFLVLVVFATVLDRQGDFDKIAGLAVGFVVAVGVFTALPFTNGALNPARWFGPAVVSNTWNDWWVYLVGPVAGGVVGAGLYEYVIRGLLTTGTTRARKATKKS
jgi:MIP family channel proteins